MKEIPFRLLDHYMIKAMDRAQIYFPISKDKLVQLAKGQMVRVDYNLDLPLEQICEKMNCDYFENKDQFFCILRNTCILTDK